MPIFRRGRADRSPAEGRDQEGGERDDARIASSHVLKKVPNEPAADPPAAAEKKDAAAAAPAVGQPVTLLRRVTFLCPLPPNATFRKDVKGGTTVKVLEIGGGADPQKLGKLLVEAQLMVKGEDMAVTGWVADDAVTTALDPSDSVEKDADAQLLPLAISKDEGGPKGSHCEALADWTELLDADSTAAQYDFLKARAKVAMQLALLQMPRYEEKDLILVNKINSKAARRVEVWTAREFAAGSLKLAAYTPELKDKVVHPQPVRFAAGPTRLCAREQGAGDGWSHPRAHVPRQPLGAQAQGASQHLILCRGAHEHRR